LIEERFDLVNRI